MIRALTRASGIALTATSITACPAVSHRSLNTAACGGQQLPHRNPSWSGVSHDEDRCSATSPILATGLPWLGNRRWGSGSIGGVDRRNWCIGNFGAQVRGAATTLLIRAGRGAPPSPSGAVGGHKAEKLHSARRRLKCSLRSPKPSMSRWSHATASRSIPRPVSTLSTEMADGT